MKTARTSAKIIIGTKEYNKIHIWLKQEYGKADKCEHCKLENKKYEYALIKGREYEYSRCSFITLCVTCHRKYDLTDTIPQNYLKTTYGEKIKQLNKDGSFVRTWQSLGQIYESLKISRGNISSVINGNRKTAGGFIWVV